MDFDPVRRAAEKQLSRDADQRALDSGAKSREELRRECGLFSFRKVKIYYAGVRPVLGLLALGLVFLPASCQKPCPCDASAFKDDDAPADDGTGRDACQRAADHLLKAAPDGLGCKEINPDFAAFCRDMTKQNIPICPLKLAKVKTCAEANTVCTKRS